MKICLQYGRIRFPLWANMAFVLFCLRKMARGKLTKQTADEIRRALKQVKRPFRLMELERNKLRLVVTR